MKFLFYLIVMDHAFYLSKSSLFLRKRHHWRIVCASLDDEVHGQETICVLYKIGSIDNCCLSLEEPLIILRSFMNYLLVINISYIISSCLVVYTTTLRREPFIYVWFIGCVDYSLGLLDYQIEKRNAWRINSEYNQNRMV